jgi:hypothetical protein
MIANLLFRHRYRRFLAACGDPVRAQAASLRRILRQASGTDIGAAAGFERLAGISDDKRMIRAYQDALPVRSCRDMRSELAAVYAGEWRRLCPSPPLFFAMTAGSTGCYKYIPVTRELRGELGAGSQIFYGALLAACPALRGLKAQFLVGSAEGGLTPTGVPQGFASGFNYRQLPRAVRSRFILPYWVFTLPDLEERLYAMGRMLAGDRSLGALCAISPVNLINLRQALERNAERLFADLEAGTLTLGCSPAVQGAYRGRPQPKLARALRDTWQWSGTLPNRRLFPALEVLVCWQGGSMSYYLDELERNYEVPHRFEFPISASEGVFAIPHRLDRAGGILAITSHYFEFLPEGASAEGTARRADQLERDAAYRLVVTNGGGLYRYDMEDIVQVTDFVGRTPVIEFISRVGHQVSVANERISDRDVTVAMQAASRAMGRWYPEFLFVPGSDRRYRVLLDGGSAGGQTPRAGVALRGFAMELEYQLRQAAMGYDFEREDGLLQPLELVVTAPGELVDYLARRQSGPKLPNAQLKPLHLAVEFDTHTSFHAVETYAA